MKKITVLFVLLFSVLLNAQVGVNTTNPDPSSMLDITATNKGVLVPRVSLTNVTTTMLDGTNTAATGLLIWNTNAATVGGNGVGFYFFNGTQWIPITQTITGNTLDQSYDQGGAGVGKNIDATDGAVRINGDDGFLVTGTYGSGNTIDTEITGTGTRMFFNPRKAAFRAGYVNGNFWDDIFIGNYSAAFGRELIASGSESFSAGFFCRANGDRSFASGSSNEANGFASSSFGNFNRSDGFASSSFGELTRAEGWASSAFGTRNIASSYGEMVIGIGATTYSPSTNGSTQFRSANASDRLFVIGNAIDLNNNNSVDTTERRDALVMLKNGNTGLGSSTPEERLHVVGNIRMVDGNQAAGRVLKSDANGTASWQIDNDNQTIDVFSLTGTTLNLSLQNDGVATQSVNLAALNTDNQTIDVFSLTGTTLNLSLSNDGVATQTVNLTSLANDWKLTGNTGTNPTFNFLGTTDNQDVSIRTNNTEKVRITAKGQIETTQLQSVWIGSSAGENATGTRNVFVGNSSGLSTSTGSDNTAIGGLTLLSNTIGFDNTAIGLASLYSLSSGDGNTAIGEQTLENFTTGSYNTFVGHLAGENYPSGLRNTIMGFQAGQNASGDGNVFIGSNAGRNSTAGNRLFIENNGADENNALIYGEFDNDILRTNSEFQVRQNSSGTLSHILLREEGANDGARIKFTNAAEADNEWVLYGRADNTVADSRFHIYHNGTGDIVRITGNGLVGIMRTPTTNALEVNGTASKTTAGGFVANSDSRLKKDIATISPNEALEKILQLRGVTYYWNDDKTGTVRPENLQVGFIAQEIAEIFPEKVTEDNLGFLQTAYGDYDPIVFQAIKALNDKIEKLENENSALKSALEKVNALEAKLEQMNIK